MDIPSLEQDAAAAPALDAELEIDEYGSPVSLGPAHWLVLFVPGLQKQWWHSLVHRRHKHVFAMQPAENGGWTLFEPWWGRLFTATLSAEQARKFLLWGARGDVLLVREEIPGRSSQMRGWMNCAGLVSHLLGRPYWVWTPHGLFESLRQEPEVYPVEVDPLLRTDLGYAAFEGLVSRICAPAAASPTQSACES